MSNERGHYGRTTIGAEPSRGHYGDTAVVDRGPVLHWKHIIGGAVVGLGIGVGLAWWKAWKIDKPFVTGRIIDLPRRKRDSDEQ